MAISARKGLGYSLVVIGLLLVLDTETFLRTGWSPLHVPLFVDTEFALAYFLIGCGVVALLAPKLIRMLSSYAPGNDVQTADLQYHSIEQRRRLRLPLRRKISVLPDRAMVGGAAVLLVLVPTFLMVTEHAISKGVYVRLMPLSAAYHNNPSVSRLSNPILLQVERGVDSPQFFLNGKEIPRGKLRDALKSELSSRPDWFVFVEGDPSLSFDDVMAAVDVVNGLHATAVLLTAKLGK